MLIILERSAEIYAAQRRLEQTIAKALSAKERRTIGFPSDNVPNALLHNDGNIWYWTADLKDEGVAHKRRLNWFGLMQPTGTVDITVEINTLYSGHSGRVGGFFARDPDTGKTYLLHSGRIGGGREGVSRSAFLAYSDQKLVEAADSKGLVREGVLVMPIQAEDAFYSARRYVLSVSKFKAAVRDGSLNSPEFKKKKKDFADYYKESSGRRRGKRSAKIDYVSRHGDVVDTLYRRRKTSLKKEERLVKNAWIDLGVELNDELSEVYEVKTSADRSSIYAAIGQLLVHGQKSSCRRFLVLPKEEILAGDLTSALEALNISIKTFSIKGATVALE